MLARSRHGPLRSLRRLILSSCSFLADQRISLLRFAPAARPSAVSHQFRSVRRPPVQSSRSSFVVPTNSVLPYASLRSNPERSFFFSRSLRSGLACRTARRPSVICSPALLCRPGEQITSVRLRSLMHWGISPVASLPSLRGMLARSRHGPFRSLRRLILCPCSFLADQRISLLRFATAVRPSVCSHQFRSVRRPPVQSSRSSFVVPANSVLPYASLRSIFVRVFSVYPPVASFRPSLFLLPSGNGKAHLSRPGPIQLPSGEYSTSASSSRKNSFSPLLRPGLGVFALVPLRSLHLLLPLPQASRWPGRICTINSSNRRVVVFCFNLYICDLD